MFKKLYKSMTVIFDIVFFRCFMVIVLAEVFYLQVVNEDFDDYARDITRPGFINNGAKGLSPQSAWRLFLLVMIPPIQSVREIRQRLAV